MVNMNLSTQHMDYTIMISNLLLLSPVSLMSQSPFTLNYDCELSFRPLDFFVMWTFKSYAESMYAPS